MDISVLSRDTIRTYFFSIFSLFSFSDGIINYKHYFLLPGFDGFDATIRFGRLQCDPGFEVLNLREMVERPHNEWSVEAERESQQPVEIHRQMRKERVRAGN